MLYVQCLSQSSQPFGGGVYHYPHFTDEEIERLNNMPRDTPGKVDDGLGDDGGVHRDHCDDDNGSNDGDR